MFSVISSLGVHMDFLDTFIQVFQVKVNQGRGLKEKNIQEK